MVVLTDQIEKTRALIESTCVDVPDKALADFIRALPAARHPTESDLDAACSAARSGMVEALFSGDWSGLQTEGKAPSDTEKAHLRMMFHSVRPPLIVPAPPRAVEPRPVALALAGVLGALAGIVFITPVARLLLGMPDVGVVLGAPLGAGLLVLLTWWAAKSRAARWTFRVGAGIGVAATLVAFLRGKGSLKRVFVAVAVMGLSWLAKPRRADERYYRAVVRNAMEQWLKSAAVLVALLLNRPTGTTGPGPKDVTRVLVSLRNLQEIPRDHWPDQLDNLLLDLRSEGILETPEAPFRRGQTFAWAESHERLFERVGKIEPGNLVRVEEEPLVCRGAVLKRGLVRKVRGAGHV